jgi:hypothetical protein
MLQKILVAFLHLLFLACCLQKIYSRAAGETQQFNCDAERKSNKIIFGFTDLPLPGC